MAPLIVSAGTAQEVCVITLTLGVLMSKLGNEKWTPTLCNKIQAADEAVEAA
ncbi:hypothetical protein D3C78_1891970 [compost metagenome]